MRVKHYIVGIVIGLLVFEGVGCRRVGRLDERERDNRIVLKAYELSNQGDYDAAIGLFTKALETYPRLSRPHLDIALLLHDRKREYVRAIYHYNRYMELRPRTEKKRMIVGRIEQAERAFVASLAAGGPTSGRSVSDLEKENDDLRERQVVLVERIEAFETELAAVREEERVRYKATVVGETGVTAAPQLPTPPISIVDEPIPARSPVEAVVRPSNVSPSPRATALPVSPPAVSAPTVAVRPVAPARSFTVRQGDSLSKIAFKVYGDATEWRKLQDANRATLGNSVNVKVGQVLVVP
jgi:tetratricopeptide (TPR) repeat protein